jgi:hypothetical protein
MCGRQATLRNYLQVLCQSIHPEFQWVVMMCILFGLRKQAWRLGDAEAHLFFTFLRAYLTPASENSMVCAGREGTEFIWINEEVLGIRRNARERGERETKEEPQEEATSEQTTPRKRRHFTSRR